jgi:predicted transcriptional regulator
MASTDEQRETDGPESSYQIDEIELSDLGAHFVDLGERLKLVGQLTQEQSVPARSGNITYMRNEYEEMTEEEVAEWESDVRKRVRGTLTGLRDFRRDYERWQRLTAEYVLTRLGYTQREAAELLGVAASTINRWAQHPLPIEDYR